jgi:looped-hinge helix DNA binding domain, AbrB family
MSKTEFKIVDDSGRVTIPKAVREALGLSAGDVVAVTHGRGIIGIKKAVVMADDKMPMPERASDASACGECGVARPVQLSEVPLRNLTELYQATTSYVDAVLREMNADALTRVVEAAAKQFSKLNEK